MNMQYEKTSYAETHRFKREPNEAIPLTLDFSAAVTDVTANGKKIVKAGTPIESKEL